MAETTPLHTTEEGAGRPLALVHGFTQTLSSWGSLAENLAVDHRVICVDAPGHGGSAAVRADLWEGGRLLGRTAGRASYVGYSMGGRLCLHLALAEPSLVDKLVLIGATAGIDDPAERALRREADEALARQLEAEGLETFLRRWLAQSLFAGLAPDAAAIEARRQNTVAGLAGSLRSAGTGAQDPLWDRLHELAMPVLVVAGERDDKFRALGERLVTSIGPNAHLAVVPNAGHAAHLEAPEHFLTLFREFLAGPG